jgi:hypothetical protein
MSLAEERKAFRKHEFSRLQNSMVAIATLKQASLSKFALLRVRESSLTANAQRHPPVGLTGK